MHVTVMDSGERERKKERQIGGKIREKERKKKGVTETSNHQNPPLSLHFLHRGCDSCASVDLLRPSRSADGRPQDAHELHHHSCTERERGAREGNMKKMKMMKKRNRRKRREMRVHEQNEHGREEAHTTEDS